MRGLDKRGLTKDEAAEYCGLSAAGFADWVRRGIAPGPIPDTHRWDRKALDLALDKASGITSTMPSAYDEWKAGRHADAT